MAKLKWWGEQGPASGTFSRPNFESDYEHKDDDGPFSKELRRATRTPKYKGDVDAALEEADEAGSAQRARDAAAERMSGTRSSRKVLGLEPEE